MMQPAWRHARVAALILAAVLAPVAVALGVRLACGICSDLLDSAWIAPIVLLAAAAVAFNAQHRAAAA